MYFLLRVVRKLAHIAFRITHKAMLFSARVEDKALRIMLGTDYSIKVRNEVPVEEKLFTAIPWITPINPSLPAVGRSAKVVLMVPSLINRGFYGGIATALIFAAKLAESRGLPLRIVQTSESGEGKGLVPFFAANDIHLTAKDIEIIDVSARRFNVYGYLDLHPDDVFVVSAWWDAHLVSGLPLLKKFVYLIQDYEPIFYPNGDMAVLAANTYQGEGFIPVMNTELMYKFMSLEGSTYIKEQGLWFEPAVSTRKTGTSVKNSGKKRLFLYGRPNVERNLFHLSLDALNRAFADGGLEAGDWELFMAGQDNIPNIRLSSGALVQNLGKLTMEEYVKFSKTIDVAVSPMMAPHPNYITLEFPSIGAAVVTTRYKTKQSLENYSKNIVMCDLSVQSLTQGVLKAAAMTYEERMENLKTTHIPDDWETQLRPVIKQVNARLKAAPKEPQTTE